MKKHMSNQKKLFKGNISWITVWLIAVAAIFVGVSVYATYTGVNNVKRVVSTKAGNGLLFSSNYMTTGTLTSIEYDDYANFFDAEHNVPLASNPEFSMIVCNYSQGDKSTWYSSSDIRYTVRAELFLSDRYTAAEAAEAGDPDLTGTFKRPTSEDLNGKQFGIKHLDDNSFSYFSSGSLTIDLPDTYSLSKQSTSTDNFVILLDKSELLNSVPKFWIKVTATPNTIVGGEVEVIDGYIGVCKSATGEASWSGSIGDENFDSIDYDAYNYIVSGNGSGTFYFAWDDSKVSPNEFSFENYRDENNQFTVYDVITWTGYSQYGNGGPSSVTGNDTWKFVAFHVDSSEVSRYEFQLYKMSGDDYSSTISNYVDYKFVPDA